MKTILSFVLILAINHYSFAQDCNQAWPLPYYQGFDSVTPPALPPCTISQSISPAVSTGASSNWKTYTGLGPLGNFLTFDIVNPLYRYDLWYFLPKISFNSNKAYKFKFSYRSSTSIPSDAPTLVVRYGICANSSCMNSFLWGNDLTNTTFQSSTVMFTPNVSGDYFIGFHHSDFGPDPAGTQPFLDSIYVEDMGPLPVALLPIAATVKNNIVTISFQTLTESNNSGFDVEQSSNGTLFTKIGFTASKAIGGNSNLPITYSFAASYNGPSFLRLRQLDKDGKFTYSNTIYVKADSRQQLSAQILQNPAGQLAKASIYMPAAGNCRLHITDAVGLSMGQQSILLAQGYNVVSLGLPNIIKGSYYMSISVDNNKTVVIPFIKE